MAITKVLQQRIGAESISRRSVLIFSVLMLALLLIAFTHNRDCLQIGEDGTAYSVLLKQQAIDKAPFTQTGVDASQANFDAYYPYFREYLLPSALTLPFTSHIPGNAATYFAYSIGLFLAFFALGTALRAPWQLTLLTAFLFNAIGLPAQVHRIGRLIENFSLNPSWLQNVICTLLIVSIFWSLNGLSRRKTYLLVLLPLLIEMFAIMGTGAQVLFMVPAVAIYSAASVFDSKGWKETIPRVAAGLLMIIVPLALGVGSYFYGLINYTAYSLFASELARPEINGTYVSTIWYSASGFITVGLGIIGAIWAAIVETDRLRRFAITHLAVTAVFFPVAYYVAFMAQDYRGSAPNYFEMCILPFAMFFASYAIQVGSRLVARLSSHFLEWPPTRYLPRWQTVTLAGPVAALALYNYWAILLDINGKCPTDYFSPIRSTVITERLQADTAVMPGKQFGGITATITGVGQGQPMNWPWLHYHDAFVWQVTGNDHRAVGLWNFGIPSLFQYFTFITPPYYLLLTEFLAAPEDAQIRSVLVLSRINAPMMKLWGVRYVITDFETNAGREVARLPVGDVPAVSLKLGTLRLIELSDPNLGNYSPTEVVLVPDFKSGLSVLHADNFDGHKTVVTDAAIDGGFTSATAVRLTYEKYGFSLQAKSAGRSNLVLPIQYSHCWSIDYPNAILFRANLMQLGVSFSGSLDAKLEFRFGPVLASGCRVEDYRDMVRLKIGTARNRGHQAQK